MMKRFAAVLTASFLAVGLAVAADAPGKADYDKACANCHGADGKAETKMGQKLKVRSFAGRKFTEQQVLDSMSKGVAAADGRAEMKPTPEDKLATAKRGDVAKYVISLSQ